MTLGVTADEIDRQLTEKGGTARFAYLLDADSAELVSRILAAGRCLASVAEPRYRPGGD